MPDPISRRLFTSLSTGLVVGSATSSASADDKPVAPAFLIPSRRHLTATIRAGVQASWKKPQINRCSCRTSSSCALRAGHGEEAARQGADADQRHDGLGGGDWESGLGSVAHGRRDIVEFLLEQGARIDIFCAAMMASSTRSSRSSRSSPS